MSRGRARKFVGENVYLSPVYESDANSFFEWMNNTDTTDYIGATTKVCTITGEQEWVKSLDKSTDEYVFSICLVSDDSLIGNVSIRHMNRVDRSCELGIMIGDNSKRSQGFGTEAMRLLLDFAFNYLNMHSVYLDYLSCNERARRCYEKAGFKFVGSKREAIYLNGKYYDRGTMDILRSEFLDSVIKNKEVK